MSLLTLEEGVVGRAAQCAFGTRITRVFAIDGVPTCMTPRADDLVGRDLSTSFVSLLDDAGAVLAMGSVQFTTRPTHSLTAVRPITGPTSGFLVTVRGRDFYASARAACQIGAKRVTASVASSSVITCASPALPPGLHAVGVTLNGLDFGEIVHTGVRYITRPTITAVSPSVIISGAGVTSLIVSGRDFAPEGEYTGLLGNTHTPFPCEREDASHLVCLAPRDAPPGNFSLTIAFSPGGAPGCKGALDVQVLNPTLTFFIP